MSFNARYICIRKNQYKLSSYWLHVRTKGHFTKVSSDFVTLTKEYTI